MYLKAICARQRTQFRVSDLYACYFRFFVPLQVYEFSITVSGCAHGNDTSCPVSMATRGEGLPGYNNATVKTECVNGEDYCVLDVFHPSTGLWNYLEIVSDSDETLTAVVEVKFSGKYCVTDIIKSVCYKKHLC